MSNTGDDQRVREHRVRFAPGAIVPGTPKETQRKCFQHLDNMSYMENPTEYRDGKGGYMKRLIGRLTGWFSFKPGEDERGKKGGEYRIVCRPEVDTRDNVKFITVGSISERDDVYDNPALRQKGKR